MPNSTIPLFVNPVAGRGRARKQVAAIAALFGDAGVSCEVVESKAVGDIEDKVYAAAMAGADRIVVAGGDGSIHEAVNGILRAGTGSALGVIPLGTGNDFAKACAIPLTWQLAAGELASRLYDNIGGRKVDIGRVNERFFANSVGIGFGAKINEIACGNRLPIGSLNYLAAVFQGVWDGVMTPAMRIRYDDIDRHETVTLVEICNGATVGGMFRMAPMARNNDGVFDLICVQPVSRPRVFTLLPRLLRGSHLSAPEVLCVPMTRIHLHADRPVPVHIDGELQVPGSEFSIEMLPGAIEIL